MNNRKLHLLLLALLALGLGTAARTAGGSAQAQPAKPNVLFIAVDDLNDWVGVLGGHPQAKTPNIDRLAQRGVLFTRAYCAAPSCNPSRTALLTGKRPSSSGVYDNNQPWRPALWDVVTLPEHFRANGYYVAGGGKIFHGGYEEPKAWETYYRRPGDPPPPKRPANGIPRTGNFDWGPLDVPDERMGDYQLAEWAGRMLEQEREKPLFLAVGFTKPHLPWHAPRNYFDQHPLAGVKLPATRAGDLADVPPAGRRMAKPEGDHRRVTETRSWEKAVQAYLATTTWLDACVGRLMERFDRSPRAKDTLIVFWGDHGWHHGQKEHWRKFALWEQANRTPLIIAAPSARPGARCSRPVNLIDLYPTLIDLCALTPRPGQEGQTLAPLLADPQAAWERPSLSTYGRGNHSLRSDRWRYIRYRDGSEELYDHEQDPHEWTNLAADPRHAAVKRELAAWLPKSDAPEARRGGRAE